MSATSPSLNDIPAKPFSFNTVKEDNHSFTDFSSLPQSDPYHHASLLTGTTSSGFNIHTSNPSSNNTYIKVQDALVSIKANNNSAKTGGLPPKSLYSQANVKLLASHPMKFQASRNPSSKVLSFAIKGPKSSPDKHLIQHTQNHERESALQTPRRNNIVTGNKGSQNTSRNNLVLSSVDSFAHKPSPARSPNKSLDNLRYSVIHKRDGSIYDQRLDSIENRPMMSGLFEDAEHFPISDRARDTYSLEHSNERDLKKFFKLESKP